MSADPPPSVNRAADRPPDAARRAGGRARRPRLVIVTPALADANNGNWQTARRWAGFLRQDCAVVLQRQWDGRPADALVALHARRSAGSIERFAAGRAPAPNLALVLTGTDLYHDIAVDATAQRALTRAGALVTLNANGPAALPAALRARARVIVQSAPARAPLPPRARTFDLLLVGHLRPEKDPITALRALARLPDPALRLRLAGGVHPDGGAAIAAAVQRAAAADPRIEPLGALPHAAARRLIRRGRVLLLPSRLEGGANVLIEAATSGVPVLCSRIAGSTGLLGADYAGCFEPGDDAALAALIERCRTEPAFLEALRAACVARAALFSPEREQRAVRHLVAGLLA